MLPLLFLLLLLASPASSGGKIGQGENGVGGLDCAWFGTAPFCSGACPKGKVEPETYVMSVGIMANYGKMCFTGKKVMCCKKRE